VVARCRAAARFFFGAFGAAHASDAEATEPSAKRASKTRQIQAVRAARLAFGAVWAGISSRFDERRIFRPDFK
jgi:hypothetical protein